ncbi:MAG: hypothetical protein V5A30_05915 [Haloarculaceae archaeon]
MPKELTIENGEVRDAEADEDAPRKFYACAHCDAVRGTREGMATHLDLKHAEAET